MGWNGAGVFNRLMNWAADKAAVIPITASRMDTDANDFATAGLGNCITRDGQGQPTANLPMATFRHTGVANGVARTDYAAMGQLEDGTVNWAAAGGTADVITATYSPAITVLVDGQLCFFRAGAANTVTTPTFSPNGLTARTITKIGGSALAAGDIPAANAEMILRYKLASTGWELLNPATLASATISSTDSGAGVAPSLDLFRDSSSPAASDFIGSVDFNGRDNAANKQLYARIVPQITDPTSTTEDAILLMQAVVAGTLATLLQTTTNGISLPGLVTPLSIPGSTTANRSGSPTGGDTRYNTSLNGLEYWNGTAWIVLGQAPTVQRLLSGAAQTYTAAAGVVRQRVRMVAGGGGGGATTTNAGTTGNTSSFQVNATGTAWTCIGGAGGAAGGAGTGAVGGAGGTPGTTGTLVSRIQGNDGGAGTTGAVTPNGYGGGGGGGFGGGGGNLSTATTGHAGAANTGGGGGGGSNGTTGGGGGGGGEYVEFWVTGMTTATYTVGASAAGGIAGSQAGGASGSGIVIIEEFYQ